MKSLQLDPGEQEYIDSRIRDIERASDRSRWVYIVSTLISLMLFSVAYNQLVSWSRAMAEGLEALAGGFTEKSWSDRFVLEQMNQWIAGLQFDLPYLGGRFSASDAGIVGGILLLITSLWGYYAMRRENRVVYYLVKDVEEFKFSDNARFYVRNQLFATQLFIQGKYNRPFNQRHITDDEYTQQSKQRRFDWWTSIRTPIVKGWAPLFVFFLPALSLVFVFGVDIASLFSNSPFRAGTSVLLEYICKGKLLTECSAFDPISRRLMLSLGLILVVYVAMRKAFMFHRGTADLVQYTAVWKASVLRHRRGKVALLNDGDDAETPRSE